MKNWLKENWFKIILLILIAGFLAVYSYDIYQTHRLTSKEKLQQRLEDSIYKN